MIKIGDGLFEDILGDKGALDFGFDDNGDLGFGADLNEETENGLNLTRKNSIGRNEDFSEFLDADMNSIYILTRSKLSNWRC